MISRRQLASMAGFVGTMLGVIVFGLTSAGEFPIAVGAFLVLALGVVVWYLTTIFAPPPAPISDRPESGNSLHITGVLLYLAVVIAAMVCVWGGAF